MALADAVAQAERVLDSALTVADRGVTMQDRDGRAATKQLLRILNDADHELARRLRNTAAGLGGPATRFSEAQLQAYRAQLQMVLDYTRARMSGLTDAASRAAVRRGWGQTVLTMGRLEQAYTGLLTPLRIGEAQAMDRATRGILASRMAQKATSLDRYGAQVVEEYERVIQQGLLVGATQSEMIDALVGHGGPKGIVSTAAVELPDGTVKRIRLEHIPEGLFRRHRWWARRLIRTEVAYAQNAAAIESLRAARGEFPDMQKKILAIMDKRTAYDSLIVHGQIRDIDATFLDGAGRVYEHPPARPNDREVVIPWRPTYTETPRSAPRPDLASEALRIWRERGTKNPPGDVVRIAMERLAARGRGGPHDRRGRLPTRADLRAAVAARGGATSPSAPVASAAEVQQARIDARREQLRRANVRPEHIDEDIAEMGAPELTKQSLQEIAQDTVRQLSKSGRGEASERAFRQGIRRIMRTIDPTYSSDDVLQGRPDRFRMSVKKMRQGVAAYHDWAGRTAYGPAYYRGGRAALERMADGRPLTAEHVQSLHVMFHEEHHGASPIGMMAYRGIGAKLEEATVELRARHHARRIASVFGEGHPASMRAPWVEADGHLNPHHSLGAYESFCRSFMRAMHDVTGLHGDDLEHHVQQRLSGWFARNAGGGGSYPEQMLDSLARAFHPDDPAALQQALRERM